MMIDKNVDYYNRNADSFFEGSINADMSVVRARFLSYVPAGGRILDAGCGSGRDSKVFMEAGYDVVSFDASEEMCKRASEYIGREVKNMNTALKNGGVMYASFKYGDGTKMRGERRFSDFNEKSIVPLFENAGFKILTNEVGHDNRPGRENEMWVEVIASKA